MSGAPIFSCRGGLIRIRKTGWFRLYCILPSPFDDWLFRFLWWRAGRRALDDL